MRVLFAGPSLSGTRWAPEQNQVIEGIDCRGPAAQGDITRAVLDGATAIGLVDGYFENTASVWHKEILYALKQGVEVLGAASMGALRAAECAPFGMIGVGRIFERYWKDGLSDDAAVAQVHAPAELGYIPLSEALVNVEATLSLLGERAAITQDEASQLRTSASSIFFKERTYASILLRAGFGGEERGIELKALIKRFRLDVKREDALLLVDRLRFHTDMRRALQRTWDMRFAYPLTTPGHANPADLSAPK